MSETDDSVTVADGVRIERDADGLTITDGTDAVSVPSRAAEPLADAIRLFGATPIDDLPEGLAAVVGDDAPADASPGDACPECGATTIDGLGGRDCPACGWTGDADATE